MTREENLAGDHAHGRRFAAVLSRARAKENRRRSRGHLHPATRKNRTCRGPRRLRSTLYLCRSVPLAPVRACWVFVQTRPYTFCTAWAKFVSEFLASL